MREDFEHWWDQEGQYSELCGKELCLIAWSNGEYKAQKELTDEEIYKVYLEVEDAKCPSDDFEYMMFARAILKKASEK